MIEYKINLSLKAEGKNGLIHKTVSRREEIQNIPHFIVRCEVYPIFNPFLCNMDNFQ